MEKSRSVVCTILVIGLIIFGIILIEGGLVYLGYSLGSLLYIIGGILVLGLILGLINFDCLAVSYLIIMLMCPVASCDSNYRKVENDKGQAIVFDLWPYPDIEIYSGKEIKEIEIKGSFNEAMELITTKLYFITGHDGRYSVARVGHEKFSGDYLIRDADKIEIVKRHYGKHEYEVFQVTISGQTHVEDLRGKDLDASGYKPDIDEWDFTYYMSSNI